MAAPHHQRSFPGVTPHLTIREKRAVEALDFYKTAFGAEVVETNLEPNGERIMQAELRVNGGAFMLSDEFPEWTGGPKPPATGVTLHLSVDDADAWADRAASGGAVVTMPVADQFWGDRYGQVMDPFGHMWSIGSPIKG